jgi:ribose transport system permease protein
MSTRQEASHVALVARVRSTRVASPSVAIWIALALLLLVSLVLAPNTVTPNAMLGILPFAALIGLAGIGQTLVVQQRGLDLTVSGMITVSAILITKIANGHDASLPLALAVVGGVAIAAGLVTGIAVTRFGITPVVATLGVGALLSGLAVQVTGGALSVAAAPLLDGFAFGKTFAVSNVVIVTIVVVSAFAIIGRQTVIGRWFVAVGANPAAGHVAGLPVARIRVGTYVVASLAYAFTGVMLAGFVGTPGVSAGDPYLLSTVAAVVLGGTSLAGGRGSVVATLGGAIFLTQLGAVVLGMGAPPAAQLILQGAIIALGMGLRNVPWSRLRRASTSAGAPPGGDGKAAAPVEGAVMEGSWAATEIEPSGSPSDLQSPTQRRLPLAMG